MIDNKKYKLVIVGTFDCENMGDLLFPIVLESYLKKRDILEELYLFSPMECQMPFFAEKHVYSIKDLDVFLTKNSVDAIIIGGGDLVRLDNHIGKSYVSTDNAVALWAIPVLLGKQRGIPVLFNCPGVPFEFGNQNKHFVKAILDKVDYLSVRDDYSRELIERCEVENKINVTVDTIMGIQEVYSVEALSKINNELKKTQIVPVNEYIVFQINNTSFNTEQKKRIKELVEKIAETYAYDIYFMPIGYEHDDDAALEELSKICRCNIYLPSKKLNPEEMISIISNASFFIGTSLHGALISYVYNVKFMEIMSGFSTKIYGFCKWINGEECIVDIEDDLWSKFLRIRDGEIQLVPHDVLLELLENHLDNMIGQFGKRCEKESFSAICDVVNLCIDYDEKIIKPKIYLDFGKGYNEKDTVYGSALSENGIFHYRFEIGENCQGIRFDPVEDFSCILVKDYFVSNKGTLKIKQTNGVEKAGIFFFDNNNPIIEFEEVQNIQWIEISAHIFRYNDADAWEKTVKECVDISKKCNELEQRAIEQEGEVNLTRELNKEIESENQKLQDEIILLNNNYEIQIEKMRLQINSLNGELDFKVGELTERVNEINTFKNLVREKDEQLHMLYQEVDALRNSTCWKITKPLRGVVLLVKGFFSPKAWGRLLKKVYMKIPLSMSVKLKVKGILFTLFRPFLKKTNAYKAWYNYNKGVNSAEESCQNIKVLSGENKDYVSQILSIPYAGCGEEFVSKRVQSIKCQKEDVKYLAFYLPQYHPFSENDEWWGKGFTEWTNVTKAVPQFVGHNQPRLAGELGYYDLRNKQNILQQMELAKMYGIYGFCMYYYWFDGKKLMDTPLNLIMENPELDLPFCLCWANENWSRKWDGKNQDILIAQNYNEKFPVKFIEDIVPFMKDSRYIRVEEKPLLIIYNANEIPDLKNTIQIWRKYCQDCGIGEIHLLAVDFALNTVSRQAGFDGFIEFPPHSVYFYGMETINDELTIIDSDYEGRVFDYGQIVREKQYLVRDTKDYYKGIFLGWDNTARRPKNGTVYHRFSIVAFKEWLDDITKFTIEKHKENDRFIFINAWNEWAEGTYLEPDRKYGYAALDTVRQVLKENSSSTRKIIYASHDACYNGAQLLSFHIIKVLKEIFHYDVYLILGDGGVLEPQFRELATDLICLGREKNKEEALKDWLDKNRCTKALCNTVVSGEVLKLLHEYGVKCISMIHEMENVVRQYHCEKKLEDIAQYAEKIVFASEFVKNSVENICNIPDKKVVIAPQGNYKINPYGSHNKINRNKIRNMYQLNESTKIALGVGFGDERKGIDLFVKTAIEVCTVHEDIAFVWVGEIEPQSYENVEQILATSKCKNSVIFAGPTDDVFLYYSASDIFVLTSREDPFPTVVMEAMEASLPVVAFEDGGGYVENISASTGALVPMADYRAMADAIISILNQNFMHIGQNAHDYVNNKFNFVGYVFKLLDLLGEHFEKVSVVIPNYNYSQYLQERIDSVLQQTYPIFEVILLDDKSRDNSVEIMRQYEKDYPFQVKVYENAVNSGNVFVQWEKGCSLAKGDYIWIAEADDLAKPEFVKSLMEVMEQDENVVIGYTQSYMMDENGKITADNYFCYTDDVDNEIWKHDYVCEAKEEIAKRLASKNTIPNVSALILKKQDFTMMFQEAKKFRVAGDWAFYVQVLEQGGKLAFVAESLNYHRRHSNSVTTDLKAQQHFDEICQMQDYVINNYKDDVDVDNVMAYRKNVKSILGV